ncbi:MAG: anti-sigma factor family protein [Thermoguttaceae bacterium]
MKCQELLSAVSEYMDGETQSALCEALQEHLAACDSCRLVIDNIRQTITLYQAGERMSLPPSLHERLCAIMRERWAAKFPVAGIR